MFYKVPMPTKANGVRLHTLPNDQIVIEYTKGTEPHIGPMAYDSSCGILAKNVTFRKSRPDAQDAMPKAGKPPIGNNDMKADTMEYDDDASKVIGKLMDYLEKYLDPDQMEAVTLILSSGEAPDLDTSGEPQERQATDRRRAARLAADAARRRPMTDATNEAYLQLFPDANRLG